DREADETWAGLGRRERREERGALQQDRDERDPRTGGPGGHEHERREQQEEDDAVAGAGHVTLEVRAPATDVVLAVAMLVGHARCSLRTVRTAQSATVAGNPVVCCR